MERCAKTTDGRHLRSYQVNEEGHANLVCRACGQDLPLTEISFAEDLRNHPVIETR